MANGYHKNMRQADEVIEIPKARSQLVHLGGTTVSFDSHESGWRWSEHVKPLVGTELCEARHIGTVISGRMGIRLQDGTEFVCEPGDVVDIPPGHDGWVVGEEPLKTIVWVGGTTWLAPLNALKERVLVTLLFTDIVDSTSTAQALGERRWTELLTTHDQRMTDAVDRYRGHIAKFTGDGILAIFDGAARAIRCGLHCRASFKWDEVFRQQYDTACLIPSSTSTVPTSATESSRKSGKAYASWWRSWKKMSHSSSGTASTSTRRARA